jgi:chromosomal replication initiator protein
MLDQDTDRRFAPEWTNRPLYRKHNEMQARIEEIRRKEARRREKHQQWESARPAPVEAPAHEPAHEPERPQPRVAEIARLCAEAAGLSVREMLSPRRAKRLVRPRQVGMYLAKKLTSRSLPEIGKRFGGRDHSTVLHSVRKIDELLKGGDNEIARFVRDVEQRL